jgi:hypothetical protein
MNRDVPEWHNVQHILRRQIKGLRVMYIQSKYQSARTMVSKLFLSRIESLRTTLCNNGKQANMVRSFMKHPNTLCA